MRVGRGCRHLVLATALALAACSPFGDDAEDSGGPTSETTAEQDGDGTAGEAGGNGELEDDGSVEDGGSREDGGSDADANEEARELPDDLDLDISESHPNGVVIQISQVRFGPNAIEVDVEILNGFDGTAELHGSIPERRMRLTDDLGNEHPLSPPPDNENLEVEKGESLEGTLVFLGRLDPDATELTVHSFGGKDGRQNPRLGHVDMDLAISLDQS